MLLENLALYDMFTVSHEGLDLSFNYYIVFSIQTNFHGDKHVNLLTFLYHLYICDGEDALLISMVTLIPVSVSLASNSQNITLWGGGRAGMRRTTQKEEQEEERNDKKW